MEVKPHDILREELGDERYNKLMDSGSMALVQWAMILYHQKLSDEERPRLDGYINWSDLWSENVDVLANIEHTERDVHAVLVRFHGQSDDAVKLKAKAK